MAQKSNAPTIEVVARLAGVSPMTVSRVINGVGHVRDSTREKVQAAITRLNYRPNTAAQRLAGSEQIRVGVLYSNPSAAYLSEFLVGLLDQSSRAHVQLVVEKCDVEADESSHARELVASGIDGLVLPPPLCDMPELLATLVELGLPTVLVASGRPDEFCNTVDIDDRRAAFEITRHVLALGHQRIGFITGHPLQTASAHRLQGYRDALESAQIPFDESLVAPGLFSYRSGLDAAEQLLTLEPRPTAVFAANDDMAAAAVAVAHRQGLDVPSDLTVVGFDDTAIATTIWPELSTIRQPIAEMARRAVELLVRQIRARRSGQEDLVAHQVLEHELVRRQSDAAPRVRPRVT
ncbi:MAG: LacI family DNA-binding transcriptional regulator [Burkholderiales bacterium]|nr:LacI family DNA-binding transcriptional regulator [Burkholderiales bacterium]